MMLYLELNLTYTHMKRITERLRLLILSSSLNLNYVIMYQFFLTYITTLPYLEVINISEQEVKDVLRNLNVTKASGPDLISPQLLKEATSLLCGPLNIFFNRLIQEGKFSLAYKESNVVPIHKKGDRSLTTNFRPISLLSNVGKTMDTLYLHTGLQLLYWQQYYYTPSVRIRSRGLDSISAH